VAADQQEEAMKSLKGSKKHCVVDVKSGKRECFASLEAAKKRMAALNGLSGGGKKKAAGCGCGG
jgi:hypothetical protein